MQQREVLIRGVNGYAGQSEETEVGLTLAEMDLLEACGAMLRAQRPSATNRVTIKRVGMRFAASAFASAPLSLSTGEELVKLVYGDSAMDALVNLRNALS